jgi:SAM-dependent methyltransferase
VSTYEPQTYGDRIASLYDAWVAPSVEATTEAAVEFLADIATGGRAVELGIGTGRIALPLAASGIDVHGIDASEAMLARLRDKPGGASLPITIGDFADVGVEGQFRLIYVVFNTFFALLSQDDQVRCFANAAAHLEERGAFVVEAFVPDPTLFDRGQRLSTTRVTLDRVQFDATRHESVAQHVTTQHVVIGKEGIMLFPVKLRYAWPSELDLMARLAGLSLAARYGGWQRERFLDSSPSHVSIYMPRGQSEAGQ